MPSFSAILSRRWFSLRKHYYAYFSPVDLVRLLYKKRLGVYPDLDTPRTFNEKVLWLSLYSDTSRWTELTDKYKVRDYITECGLKQMLNELYAVWSTPKQVTISNELPKELVLKTNCGCGDIIVVKDRAAEDVTAIRRKLAHVLKRQYGFKTAEHHYFGIKPCIVAEKFLPHNPVFGCSLVDYKFFCLDGQPRYCMVCYDRKTHHDVKTGLYDATTWEDLSHHVINNYRDPNQPKFPPPTSLGQMLDAARRLSFGFPQVRIDFYEVEGRPIFGEMTFTSAAGMDTGLSEEFQLLMGASITLPGAKSRNF